MAEPLRPLQGAIVVDLSQNLPGPLLTRVLCDLGAQVIKIEPKHGEGLRWMPPHRGGMGVAFGSLNAGKKSVAADLKTSEGQALVRAIVGRADILVESFRPGVLARLGLEIGGLMEADPRLIVVSLTGFGQDTPLSRAPGHDLTFLARTGLLGLQGPPDGPPIPMSAQVADVGGGSYPAAIGVLSAWIERERTGRGRHLDIGLARSVAAFSPVLLVAALTGEGAPRGRDALTGAIPCYRCYATSDGRYLAVGALEPHFWGSFCAVLEQPDLVIKQYSNDPADHALVEEILGARPLEHWVSVFEGSDACVEAVRTPAEGLTDPSWDPQVRGAGLHTVFPLHVGAPTPESIEPPSQLGADLDAVAAELEIDDALVQAARTAGAVP